MGGAMKTGPGVREVTLEAMVGDRVAVHINFANMVGQHGDIVVADSTITAVSGFTKVSETWSASNTYLTVVVVAPDEQSIGIRALEMAIKFSALGEILNFEVHMNITT